MQEPRKERNVQIDEEKRKENIVVGRSIVRIGKRIRRRLLAKVGVRGRGGD